MSQTFYPLFAMGDYGYYVWSAYAITLTVFGINLFVCLRESQKAKRQIKHFLKSVTRHES